MSNIPISLSRDGLRLVRMALGAGAAAALLALSASAVAQVVVRDAATGEMRPATSDEFAGLKAQEAAQKASAAQQKAAAPVQRKSLQAAAAPLVNLPGNTVQGVVDEESIMYSVMTRDAAGTLVLQCVRGKSAVDAAVNQNAPVSTHTEEHPHDTE